MSIREGLKSHCVNSRRFKEPDMQILGEKAPFFEIITADLSGAFSRPSGVSVPSNLRERKINSERS